MKINIKVFAFLLIIFALLFVIGFTSQPKAAFQGDVLINEFLTDPSGANEWYEVLNNTSSGINLAGWTINRSVTADAVPLSGTLPAHGILVFTIAKNPANNAGDVLTLKDAASNSIAVVSYGNQANPLPHVAAPAADNSAYISEYIPGALVYSTTASPTMGWFNNAVAWTCPQIAGTGSPALPPTLVSIAACLSSESGIVSNIGGLVNPSAATGLYFEKRTDVADPATAIGKIEFAGPLNLADGPTTTYLKTLGATLEATSAFEQTKVGLDSTIASNFTTNSATITMYKLTATHSAPPLLVRDNSHNVLNCSLATPPVGCPEITPGAFDDVGHTYTFTTNHFTTFENEQTVPAIPVAQIIGTTIQGAGDTIAIPFGEPVVAVDGTWSANEFTAIESPNGTALSLAGATFSYNAGLAALTITLLPSVNLTNGAIVAVTPALNAIKDPAGNTLPITERVGTTPITGDLDAPTAIIEYSKDAGATYASTISAKDADTLRIRATFNEAMAVSPIVKLAIDGAVLAATNMSFTDETHYYYDLNVPVGNIATATVSLSVGLDLAGNGITAAPTSGATFTIDNTAPTASKPTAVAQILKAGAVSTSTIQSTEAGNIYLVKNGTAATTQAQIDAAIVAHTAFIGRAAAVAATPYTVTVAADLVDGVYDIVAVDAAGNVSAIVGGWLTVDNAPPATPVITSVATDAKITDAEQAAITIIGTAEASSTVTVTLTDSALTPISNTGTAAGGNYSIQIDGTTLLDGSINVSVMATDAATNVSTAATTTATKDVVVPTITSRETQDLDVDGRIDAVKITFNKAISDATVVAVDFDVAGYADEAFSGTTNSDVANNNVIYITFTEGLTLDTGAVPNVTYTIGTLADAVGNPVATGTVAATDKALPIVTKWGANVADVALAIGDTSLLFSETLSATSKTAVQNALTAGADHALTYAWTNEVLTVSAAAITTFANDVVVASIIDPSGNISTNVLLVDSIISATQVAPNGSGAAAINNTTSQAVVTSPTQAITVTVGAGTTAPTVNFDALITNGTGVLPQTTINAVNSNNVVVSIPNATTVTSTDPVWDGVLAAPTTTTVTMPTLSGQTLTQSSAIEIGFTGAQLTFDKGVRILFPGQAGKRIGYIRTGIIFTEIINLCGADSQAVGNALAAGSECKIDSGLDAVVWTKHFTSFATFTSTAASGNLGGGGGGGGGSMGSGPIAPTGGFILQINNGAASTLSNTVTLTINGGAQAVKMAIANSGDFSGSSQETYAATKQWTLSAGNGTKMVCVKFYSSSGYYSSNVCASIYLGNAPTGTVTATTGTTTGASTSNAARLTYLINATKYKETSANVSEMQQLLKTNGYFTYPTITGYYGDATQTAVKNYQAGLNSNLTFNFRGTAVPLAKPLAQMDRNDLLGLLMQLIALMQTH